MPAYLLAAAIATSAIGELHTYRDWIVGCDNLHACHATTLIPEPTEAEIETGDEPSADNLFNLSLRRDGGMHDQPRMRLLACYMCDSETGREPALARELRVRGKDGTVVERQMFTAAEAASLGSDGGISIPADGRLIGGLMRGDTVEVYDGEGHYLAAISLRGLNAAMRHMDESQHRSGTVTALVARGPGDAILIPPRPPEPFIRVPPPSDRPPVRLPAQELAVLQEQYRCDTGGTGLPEAFSARLDESNTMLLLFANCSAYNGEGYVFLIGEDQSVRPAPVRLVPHDPEFELPQVVSAYWDAKERRLHSFGRGRALADCGQDQAFAWDGEQFILVEEADMGECRGSIDYITVYRRETVIRAPRR